MASYSSRHKSCPTRLHCSHAKQCLQSEMVHATLLSMSTSSAWPRASPKALRYCQIQIQNIDKTLVGADAVSSLQSKSKSRGKGRAKRWQFFLHCPWTGTVWCCEAAATYCTEKQSLLFAQSLPLIRAGLGQTAGFAVSCALPPA